VTSYARAAAAAERDEREARAWLDTFGADITTDPLPDDMDERVTQALAPMLGRQLADPDAPDVDYVYVRDVYFTHLMGEPVDDRSEHAGRGDSVERRRGRLRRARDEHYVGGYRPGGHVRVIPRCRQRDERRRRPHGPGGVPGYGTASRYAPAHLPSERTQAHGYLHVRHLHQVQDTSTRPTSPRSYH
jgi:hypothetical protein